MSEDSLVVGASSLAPRKTVCPTENVNRGVMITVKHKSTSHAAMLAHRQRLAYPVAAIAAILRSELRRDSPHPTASVFRFTRQDQKEGSPRRVTNALRQMMVLDHPCDLQILNRDLVKLSNQIKRAFVKEVFAPVRHFQ